MDVPKQCEPTTVFDNVWSWYGEGVGREGGGGDGPET